MWWVLWNVADAADSADETTALAGFALTWERRPHRIKVLGIDVAGAELDDVADIQGGAWADGDRGWDTARAEADLVGFAGRPIHTGTARLTVEGRGALWARRRELGVATTTVEVPGADKGEVAVWITGFRFATDTSHPDGFTLHTLSVTLGTPEIRDGTAQVPLRVAFGGGAVPDRAQSLGDYGADVEISWVAVPCRPDELQRETVSRAVHLAPIAAGRHRDAERVTSELVWSLQAQEVAVGLSGFEVDIYDGLFDGRYARSLLFRVLPDDAPLRSEVQLGFDNAGPMARAVRVALRADVTALAVRPTDTAWRRAWVSADPAPLVAGRRRIRTPVPRSP